MNTQECEGENYNQHNLSSVGMFILLSLLVMDAVPVSMENVVVSS